MANFALNRDGPTELFRMGHDRFPLPLELWNRNGQVVYWNPVFQSCFGWDLRESQGQPSVLFAPYCRSVGGVEVLLDRIHSRGVWKDELTVTTRDGRQIPERVSVFSLGEGPDDFQVLVLHEDLVEELNQRSEKERHQRLLSLQARQAQTSDLLNIIAHQWRQPLTVVSALIGNLQLRSQIGNLDHEYLLAKLEKMSSAIQSLSETIESFRTFYRSSSKRSVENVVGLTQTVVSILAETFEKSGITLELLGSRQPILTAVYAGELIQALIELVNKARECLLESKTDSARVRLSWNQEGAQAILRIEHQHGDSCLVGPNGPQPDWLNSCLARIIVEHLHGGQLSAREVSGWTVFELVLTLEALE